MGWFGEPTAHSKKDLQQIIVDIFGNSFLAKSQIKDDHFWVLYNNKGVTNATCYLINEDNNEFSYKPIDIEAGPNYCDIPKTWVNKITDVEDRNLKYSKHLKTWLNKARHHNNMKIKRYEDFETNNYSEYKGKISNMKHLIATDPHYGSDVWCRYEKKFDKPINCDVDLIINNQDYYEVYNDYVLNMDGVSFTLLLRNADLPMIDKTLRLKEDKGIIYSKLYEITKTEIGMDTAQVALGVNDKAKEIADYYKDYDNDSIDLDGYRPYFSIETLTDGIFGDVKEYTYQGNLGGIIITGWVDGDTDYDEEKLVNYLKDRLEIEGLDKVYNSYEHYQSMVKESDLSV